MRAPHPRPSLTARLQAMLDRLDESGVATLLLIGAFVAALVYLWFTTRSPAAAATPAADGPTPSSVAGIIVTFVPIALAVALMGCVFRKRAAPAADEDAYGDTTRFGERLP